MERVKPMDTKIQIKARYNGPDNMGNGGYVCGMLDNHTPFLSKITLRKPIPLETDLSFLDIEMKIQLMQGMELIATAEPGEVEIEIPQAPDFETARQRFPELYRT